MNTRRRLEREIIRHRRNGTWYPTLTRLTLANGARVRVVPRFPHSHDWGQEYQATYRVTHARVTHARVHGVWPPTPELIRELGRWA